MEWKCDTKAEWLESLEEWERVVEYEPVEFRQKVKTIRQYTRFRDNGIVYLAYSQPFTLRGNTYITVWKEGNPREYREELKLPEFTVVDIMISITPHPFPKWYFEKRKSENR